MIVLVLLVLGCTPTDTDTDTDDATTGIEVTLTVDDPGKLPPDDGAAFDVWVAEGLGNHVADGTVEPQDTVRLEVEPGLWDVWATFVWVDPDRQDTGDTGDTGGGYIHTECSGHETVEVVDGALAAVAMQAQCGDVSTD